MDYDKIKTTLDRIIKEESEQVAIEFIKKFGEPGYRMHNTTENVVSLVVTNPKATDQMIDAACQAFVDIGTDGSWVHSLSHFTGRLWGNRHKKPCTQWIQTFNKMAFDLAKKGNTSCCERLVDDFLDYGAWSDNPKDFHLIPENLKWVDWEYHSEAKARIAAGVFTSEDSFLIWKEKMQQENTDDIPSVS